MRDTIEWLMNVERLAGDVYRQAIPHFQDDGPFQAFLAGAAEDEAWHYHIMASARESIRTNLELKLSIRVELEVKDKIEQSLRAIQSSILLGTMTKESLAEGIANAEFSEWNDIFIHVATTLKQQVHEFIYVAPKIQNHKRKLLQFLSELPSGMAKAKHLELTQPIWHESILVVEDDDALRESLLYILSDDDSVRVDLAPNGKIGLAMAAEKFYRVILSDIDMPEMNGIQMFKELLSKYSSIPSRFILMSGDLSNEKRVFVQDHALEFLAKPTSIRDIKNCVQRIFLKDPAGQL
jgi:CheY-like chemotaxis protein